MVRLHKRQRNRHSSLDEILNGPDEYGLLTVKQRQVAPSKEDIAITKFEEINLFVDNNSRTPSAQSEIQAEKALARRLNAFLVHPKAKLALAPYDRYGLLSAEPAKSAAPKKATMDPEEVMSLDDIFASDDLGLLDYSDDDIFDHKLIASNKGKETPDEIAQRVPCTDFWQFDSLFNQMHEELRSGAAESIRFAKETQIEQGDFFVLQGVMCLVDTVGDEIEESGRFNARLRLIFENGTESNMLLRSLARALYKDETGRRILKNPDSLADTFKGITHRDKRSGMIYIVTSLSENATLKNVPNLYKIGYTEKTVEERTKNALRDTAFLEGPIRVVSTFECFNLNPHRFETLVHAFLSAQRLNLTLTGRNGETYHPQEWFSVPLKTAIEVVKRIVDGSIVQYRMDNTTGRIIKKNATPS